jgi:thiamine kinase-like enzyme
MKPVVQIVQGLEALLGEANSEPTPLDGGITNKNFRITMGGSDYVIRVPGKDTSLLGIDRGAERESGELASRVGISPEVVARMTDPPCLVTRFVEGETLTAEKLRDPATLSEVASALTKLHSAGATLPTEFDSFRVIEDYAKTAADRGVEVPASYEESHGHSKRIEAALSGLEHTPVPCHNDLLAANFIRGERLWIVDWDYAGMGDRYFDLGNFAVNNELDDDAARDFLRAYFGEEPGERRMATLRLFRFMSDFREAMWGVVQQGISDLDFDFVDYAGKHFQRLRDAAADPQFEPAIERAAGD